MITHMGKLPAFHETGTASWYGAHFQGRKTASGERFDSHLLTAAHRTLPLGSYVRIRSHSNNKSVVVRINDRGPQDKSRMIDVSYAAAVALDMVAKGCTEVDIESPD